MPYCSYSLSETLVHHSPVCPPSGVPPSSPDTDKRTIISLHCSPQPTSPSFCGYTHLPPGTSPSPKTAKNISSLFGAIQRWTCLFASNPCPAAQPMWKSQIDEFKVTHNYSK
ncbi:hypothetical protein XENORESO_010158 [Xenotaenia resolanae]|uniref:Uncharacterized protein n=1 Tax=Xenotaenia resolanae TaxID=208358 RepID=A0ABV0X7T8_9TELE